MAKSYALIVDDEPEALNLVRRLLEADGFEVVVAEDAAKGLELFDRLHPELVLLDILLPNVDGIELLKVMRRRDPVAAIVMVSALSSERIILESLLAGADEYIAKPFPLKELRIRIRKALEKSRLRRENVRLQEELNRANERLRQLFERYMPSPVAERLIAAPTLPDLGGTRQVISVLFADLRGFTMFAESMPPDALMDVLNAYLSLASDVVIRYEGTLDKFMGDAIMAFFNAPVPQEDHALRAVCTATEIHERVAQEGPEANGRRLGFGIGIHTGDAVVGNVGSQYLMNYTALGDSVNVAKRLQEMAGPGQTLISQATYELVRDWVDVVPLGERRLEGRQAPIHVYEVRAVRLSPAERERLTRPLEPVASAKVNAEDVEETQ